MVNTAAVEKLEELEKLREFLTDKNFVRGVERILDVQDAISWVLGYGFANTDVVESQKDTAQTLYFKTIFQMPTKTSIPMMQTVSLKAICGPGDNAEPVIAIMLENED